MSQTFEVNYQSWKRLFLFCFGLVAGTAFCMKWMEDDFWVGGEQFTILGLELFYTEDKMLLLAGEMTGPIKTILRYHLSFDFAFMAGVYPGIIALCMMTREKLPGSFVRKLLISLAALQLLAWAADVLENYCLFEWINQPARFAEFPWFHFIVALKWVIALSGVLVASILRLRARRPFRK